MVIVCALLSFFGMIRIWQDGRDEVSSSQMLKPLFSLSLISKTLGVWSVKEGEQGKLDSSIVKMTGSIGEPLERVYVNKETGVKLAVLVLYGPAEKVTGHIPEVCYPAIGYDFVESFDLKSPGPRAMEYRSLLFVKKGGTTPVRDEVYYTFRRAGIWSPTVSGNWKALQSGPPVFKIQIQRPVVEREHRGVNNPCQQFLEEIIPEIERLIAAAQQSGGASPVPVPEPVARKE